MHKRKFVVCGEALFDVFVGPHTKVGVTLEARLGGSPFNTAIGLARLGQPVQLLAAVSRDVFGERIVRALADESVDVTAIETNDGRTTLSVVSLDKDGVPCYSFYGEQGADRMLSAAALTAVAEDARAIHVGSYPLVVEPIASTLRVLVEREHGRTPIVYDPNVRLSVVPDIARWREALDWMLARTQLLKISEEDLRLLHPGLTADAFAAHALHQGVALVVMTRGAEGACAWTGAARAAVRGIQVAVVDTVGAGDSFQAALLTWLAEHATLEPSGLGRIDSGDLMAALAFATRAASLTCSRCGADLPRRGELGPA